MTRRRWIADEISGDRASLTGEHADHLVRALRARVGQEFDIATGAVVRRGRVASIEEGRVDFELMEEIAANTAVGVTLLLAIFKFDRLEWAIEKCTELGVTRIIPVVARRTNTHLASAAARRAERWRRIALQAAEQSRRATPPEIAIPRKVKDAARLQAGLRIVLAESEAQNQIRDVLATHPAESETILAIGPEGGWTDDELQIFQEAGWISASLGSTILRAETAAIVATAITMSELALRQRTALR